MPVSPEALDIILRLQGVPAYIAGMREASAANKEFAASQATAAKASTESAAASEKAAGGAALASKAMKVGVLATAAAVFEGIKMSINFNKTMERVHTLTGDSQASIERLKGEVLSLAETVPQGPGKLAEGLYILESIGLRGAQSMKALTLSAKAAAMGNADLVQTASALGAAWLTNIKGSGDFHHTLGVLTATVGAGRMQFGDMIRALGSGILPVAKIAHISLQEVGAAMATLTDAGYTAPSAMAQLGTALHFLYDPSTKAKKALESIGLTQKDLFHELEGPQGLRGALKLLKEHLAGVGGAAEQSEKLGEILPGGRGKVLLSLMELLERFGMKHKQIVEQSGGLDEKFRRTEETSAYKIETAWSKLQAILIRLGKALEGPFTDALTAALGALGGIVKAIMAMTDNGRILAPILIGLTASWLAYKGVVMLSAIWTAATAAAEAGVAASSAAAVIGVDSLSASFLGLGVAMDTAGIGLVFLAITLVVVGVYMLIKSFDDVKGWVQHNWPIIGAAILLMFGPIGQATLAIIMIIKHWKDVKTFVVGAVHTMANALAYPFEWLWQKAQWVFEHIRQGAEHLPSSIIKSIPLIGGPASDIGHKLGIFGEGGTMSQAGWATINDRGPGEQVWLPQGASVSPSPATALAQPRAHTPTPLPATPDRPIQIEAYFMLPRSVGAGLFKLVTQEAAIKGART